MERLVIYHNPACSKSRGALEILRDRGVPHDVVQYLDTHVDRATLERMLERLPGSPAALVRKDKRFRELQLDAADYQSAAEVIALLLAHPELMERPVIIRGTRAVIARPPELVNDLLD
jgi:arsenate reductase